MVGLLPVTTGRHIPDGMRPQASSSITKKCKNNEYMKKFLLLLIMCIPAALAAQSDNGVTVENLEVSAGTVTFDVSWDKNTIPPAAAPWSDTVWVFVDYNNAGKMERLLLLPGATLTETSAPGLSWVEYAENNNKGVWVVGNAKGASNSSGSFSATVKLLFDAATNVTGACAYASNYPPVGKYTSPTNISFTGTPIYNIVLKDGSGVTSVWQSDGVFTVPAGYTYDSFTDKTGAPGKLSCIPSSVYTLQASAPAFCAGSAGVVFALDGTESGRSYQLLRDDAPVGALNGTGSAATFSGTFAVAGVYTAEVSVADGTYCAATMNGSHNIAENPLPSPPAMGGGGSQCGGTLPITASPGTNGTGIRWTDNGSTETTRNVGTGTYYAVTTNSTTGCESTSSGVAVTINTVPSAPTMGGGGSQCGGTLPITASPGTNGTGIRWTDNGSTEPTRNVGTGTYYAVTTSAAGCESSANGVAVTINAVPDAPTMSGGGTQCGGTLPITASPGTNGTGIRWTDNGSTETTRNVGTGSYYAVSTSAAGCESGANGVAVTINTVPGAPTMGGGGTQCGGTLPITASPGTNGTGIRWTDNGGTETTRNVGTGTYYAVTTNSTTGCESTSSGVAVTINAVPGAPSVSGAGTACGSKTITASAGSNGTGIRWTDNNSTSTSRSVSASGNYYAVTTNSTTGCESTSSGVAVTIYAAPSAPTMGGGGTQCGGTRTITATAGSGGNGIRWTDDNSTTSSRSVSATGSYYAVTTSANGCESSSAYVSVTIGQPGTAGQSASCGCASGLVDCKGICWDNCTANCITCSHTCAANQPSYIGAAFNPANNACACITSVTTTTVTGFILTWTSGSWVVVGQTFSMPLLDIQPSACPFKF
jgi:hypothetical protein